MKITLKEDATSGNVFIPRGEYIVALASESQEINLVGKGQSYKIPAVKRRSQGRTRVTTVSFFSGGGNSWSLVVNTPKYGEWYASIEYSKKSKLK